MAKQLTTVKAFLQYPEGLELGSSPDIRRFKLAKDGEAAGSDLYHRLTGTLHAVFPDIAGLSYSLFWKDEEDDLVRISTMGELQSAIDSMTDNLLRLYIIVESEEASDTSETGSDIEGEVTPQRVRFLNAGKRWRRRLRRRRKAALTDNEVVSKEYRKGVRLLIKQLHRRKRDGGKVVSSDDDGDGDEDEAALAALTPEVQVFVKAVVEEWHSKLSQKRPRVVAKKMRKEKRSLPSGLEKDHFRWLCRHMARWHRRHAGKCDVMSGWSSGDTGDDTSGDEEMLAEYHKVSQSEKKGDKQEGGATASESEDPDGAETSDHTEPKEFRTDVRVMMQQLHRKKVSGGQEQTTTTTTTLAALTPAMKEFIQQLSYDWHSQLKYRRPRAVAKRIRTEARTLPSGLQKDGFRWLCRFFKRWHRRHAGKCEIMSGWSSGESSGDEEDKSANDDKRKRKPSTEKGEKQEKKGGKSDANDTEDSKEVDDPLSKEFRKDVRVLVSQLHRTKKAAGKGVQSKDGQEQTTVVTLSPEVQTFVQQVVERWHSKLSQVPPRLVAKRIKKEETRNLPPGLDKEHFRWLRRFLARWHRRHAGKCDVMSGWSSGETGDDTSGDERAPCKRGGRSPCGRHGNLLSSGGISESEDTDCLEKACKPVSKEFRTEVRATISKFHKETSDEKEEFKHKTAAGSITTSPEVQEFLRQFSAEWHAKLSKGMRPRAVSKEMKEEERTLPSRMENEQYIWLCCFMARWHLKHAGKCDVMSGSFGGNQTGAEA